MAEIKQSFITFCNNNAAIFAVMGNRLTAENVPDNQAYPYGVVNEITGPLRYTFQGDAGRVVTLQIDVFGETQTQADAAAEALKAALSGYRGMMGSLNAGRVFVTDVRGNWDGDLRSYRRILEISIGTND